MTDAAERRDRIVEYVRARGWVPIAKLARWLHREFAISRAAGASLLLDLVRSGRLERRRTTPDGWPRYEYRAVDGGTP